MAEINGTQGPDNLMGTQEVDTILGFGGDDTLFGLQNNDFIQGDDGNDLIFGNQGGDFLRGGAGADTLFGGQDDDNLTDSSPPDSASRNFMYGNKGNDTLFINGGFLYGGQGDDSIIGGSGVTNLSGDFGRDTLVGGSGRDIFTITPKDQVFNSADADIIQGFDPNSRDILFLETGSGLTANDVTLTPDVASNSTAIIIAATGQVLAVLENTLLTKEDIPNLIQPSGNPLAINNFMELF